MRITVDQARIDMKISIATFADPEYLFSISAVENIIDLEIRVILIRISLL